MMKMNKVLVKIYIPMMEKEYDVWIPLNRSISTIITLLVKGVSDLNKGCYTPKNIPTLYNKKTAEIYDTNKKVIETDIRNGTELLLI